MDLAERNEHLDQPGHRDSNAGGERLTERFSGGDHGLYRDSHRSGRDQHLFRDRHGDTAVADVHSFLEPSIDHPGKFFHAFLDFAKRHFGFDQPGLWSHHFRQRFCIGITDVDHDLHRHGQRHRRN